MTNAKFTKIERLAECGKYGSTFSACFKTLKEHTDLDKLTAKQIAGIIDAMYTSYQYGYSAGINA